MYSDLDRQLLVVPWVLFAGDMPNVIAVVGNSQVHRVPTNCVLTELSTSAQAITAASQWVVTLLRGSTVLASVSTAVPYVAGVVAVTTGLSIALSRGDILTVKVNGTDVDTDDITALIIEATLQPLANAPSI